MMEHEIPKWSLDGKTAIVSGCANARGFGRAIACRLGQAGANLLVTDVECKLSELEREAVSIQKMGCRVSYAVGDVRSAKSANNIVDNALDIYGRVDILVNNAAAPPGADRVSLTELTEEAWDDVLNTNLKGAFLMTRQAARAMVEQGEGGRIINIASVTGKIPYSKMAAYSASKAGLLGFSRAAALELAPDQITVNAVCPGVADTNRIDYLGNTSDGNFDADLRASRLNEREKNIPLGRVAAPEDIANVVVFLASDNAAYLTGEFINIAGGSVMD